MARGKRRAKRRPRVEFCESRTLFAADFAWQNPDVAVDVVPDGQVVPQDLLWLVNDLRRSGERALSGEPQWTTVASEPTMVSSTVSGYLDVNGDGQATWADCDAVLGALEVLSQPLAATAVAGGISASRDADSAASPPPGADDRPPETPDGTLPVAVAALECAGVPVAAGPLPTLVLDNQFGVHAGNWRPAWTMLDDLAQQGLIIDDYDSPYAAPGARFDYTDDTGLVVPKWADVPGIADDHLAWLEIVGYRSYYVGTNLANKSNATPLTSSFDWEQSVATTSGTTITQTASTTVGAELGGRLEGISAKLQASTSASLTVATQSQTTATVTITVHEQVPACSAVGLYKMSRIVEVLVDYVYMHDTPLGVTWGYEREDGRARLRSEIPAGHRTIVAAGQIVPVPLGDGPMFL